MVTVVIRDYPISKEFHVAAVWNNGHNWAVFETVDRARISMIARFGDCKFLDHRRGVSRDGKQDD